MITIKSAREIALMREAGHIVALTHKVIKEHIKAGVTTMELDRVAEQSIRSLGGIPSFKGYNGFPGSICASINEVVIHGIPGKQTLKEGDIIAIDIGCEYQGYHGDSAWSYPVGKISEADAKLLKVTEDALWEGLHVVKSGIHLSDISHAIESYVLKHGFSVVEEFTGHGIGRKLHEEPAIPNFGKPNLGPILKSGMTLAIEPMVNAGSKKIKVLLDNWTTVTRDKQKSAHFEHSVLVTDEGFEILTKIKEDL